MKQKKNGKNMANQSILLPGTESQTYVPNRFLKVTGGSLESILQQSPPLLQTNSPLTEKKGDANTKISHIRTNAALKRTQNQSNQLTTHYRIGQYATNKRRSPIWVGKIDPGAYMKNDRNTGCQSIEPASEPQHEQAPIRTKKPHTIIIKSKQSNKLNTPAEQSISPLATERAVSGFKALEQLVKNASTSNLEAQQVKEQAQKRVQARHDGNCKMPFSLQTIEPSNQRQPNRMVVISELNARENKNLQAKQFQKPFVPTLTETEDIDQTSFVKQQFGTISQNVAAQKIESYASLQPRSLELNVQALVDRGMFDESLQGGAYGPLEHHAQKLQQHLQQVAAQKRPIVSKQRAAVAIKRQKDFTMRMKAESNEIAQNKQQTQKISSECHFNGQNLYGNLTGTQHRTQAPSINSSSITNSFGENEELAQFLQRQAVSTGEWREVSMTNLLSQLESDTSAKGDFGKVSPQLPQLPKTSKKPKHILVQEVRDHHANEIDLQSMKSKRLETDPSSPKSRKSNHPHQVQFRHIDDSELDSEAAASMILKSPLRGSRVNERTRKLGQGSDNLVRTHQIISQSQGRAETVRQSQNTASNGMNNQQDTDDGWHMSGEHQRMLQHVLNKGNLPTLSIASASPVGYKHRRVIALENRSKNRGGKDEKGGINSVMSRTSSQRSLRPRQKRHQKYEEARQEMIALNTDPSRDVLQTMLNPYDGFDVEEGAMTTRADFKTRRTSKFAPPNFVKKRRSEVQITAEKPASSAYSDKEFQILQPMMQQNGSGIQSMPPCDFQSEIRKLDENSDNKTPEMMTTSQGNFRVRRRVQQPGSMPLQTKVHNLSLPIQPELRQKAKLLPDIGMSNRSSINPTTNQSKQSSRHNAVQTQKTAPSLRQLNPRKFTVDTISQLQMNMVLSGTASTGGTDFSPPPQSYLVKPMLGISGQHQQVLTQVTQDAPPQFILQNSFKPGSVVAPPKKKKEPYKSPYAQQLLVPTSKNSGATQKTQTEKRFDETMDQISPWD